MKKTKKQNKAIKKLLILTLCLTIALGLTACKNSKIDTDELESGLEELSGILETEETEEETKESEETKAPKVNDKPEETTKPEETKTPEKDVKPKGDDKPKETEAPNPSVTPKAPTPTTTPKAQEPSYKKVSDTKYAKSNVNVRSGPGTSHKKIGSLKAGQKVTRIGVADNGWGVIDFNGKEGYVSGKYLVENKPAVQTVEKPKDSKPAETKAKPAEPKGQDTKKDEAKPAEKTEYVPLAEGWIYEKTKIGSAMNSTQQAQIDKWVKVWRDGGMSDEELKREIHGYLSTEGISFTMLLVYNKSRFISDTSDVIFHPHSEDIPYSYQATYCTGERDPNSSRDYTVFYEWIVEID